MPNDDDYQWVEYDIDYRSENHNLSKYIKAYYSDDTQKDIYLDTITQAQPRLWAAKQDVLKIMDDYNLTFMLGSFTAVFFVLTMATSITPVAEIPGVTPARGSIFRRAMPKQEPVELPGMLESKGAVKPGTGGRTYTDPFTGQTSPISATAKTPRSTVTSIRADVAESEAYKAALARGEIGLQRPTGANIPGTDFITAVVRKGTKQVLRVLVNDVKATVKGRFPAPKASAPGSWQTEVTNAVAPGRLNLGDAALENEIRMAVQQGRVQMRQLNVNYSAQGQGQITGW